MGIVTTPAQAHWPYSWATVQSNFLADNLDGWCGYSWNHYCSGGKYAWYVSRVGDHSYRVDGGFYETIVGKVGTFPCDGQVRVFGHWEGEFNIGEFYTAGSRSGNCYWAPN
jgi:hypothetical protein